MPDIVIGARRPSHFRRLRAAAIAAALVLACTLVAYFMYQRIVSYEVPDARVPDHPVIAMVDAGDLGDGAPQGLQFGTSSLSYVGAIAVLRSAGSPQEIGAAHGRLLGEAARAPIGAFTESIASAVPSGGWLGGFGYPVRVRWRYRLLDDGIPGHQLVEVASLGEGVARSTGWTPGYERLVRGQAALDVGAAVPWSASGEYRALARSLSMVTKLRAASGDRLVIGRSFALPGVGDGGDAAAASLTVSFVRPDGVIPFVSIGWPGLVGVVSGINAEGIAVMVHPVRTRDVSVTRKSQPVALLCRDVLENARTLDDAISILEHATTLGAAAFVVADGNARTWAVIERSPSRVAVKLHDQAGAVTDLFTAEPFRDDPENDRARRVSPSVMRGKRAQALLRGRLEQPDSFAAVLRDRQDVRGAPLPVGHRGAVFDPSAVHVALLDTSGMILWVADSGDADAAFRAFDLRHELRGEGARPAAPSDWPAAATSGGVPSWRVRKARGHLRAARRMWQDGARDRAREEIERALASAPELPEALSLAGQLASSMGQDDRARLFYQRYLDASPDDLGEAQEIRALLDN